MNIAKDEQHDGNVENAVARLDESIETIVVLEMKSVNIVEDGGYAWMVLNEPPAPPQRLLLLLCLLLLETVDCLRQHFHLLH